LEKIKDILAVDQKPAGAAVTEQKTVEQKTD
jgi:hypothetical protein